MNSFFGGLINTDEKFYLTYEFKFPITMMGYSIKSAICDSDPKKWTVYGQVLDHETQEIIDYKKALSTHENHQIQKPWTV